MDAYNKSHNICGSTKVGKVWNTTSR